MVSVEEQVWNKPLSTVKSNVYGKYNSNVNNVETNIYYITYNSFDRFIWDMLYTQIGYAIGYYDPKYLSDFT